jgi:DedD protein
MTLIQQKRLVGAILLLFIISALSYFLISGANTKTESESKIEEPLPQSFSSVVEPITEDRVEVLEYVDEVKLDPQNLSLSEQSVNDNDAKSNPEENSTSLKSEEQLPSLKADTPKQTLTSATWIVQLGSFSVKENADALALQVSKLKYKPSIEANTTGKTTIYRVRLAPVEDKITADKIAAKLTKILKLTPQVFQNDN